MIRIHGRREFFSSKIDEYFDITIIKTNIYSCNLDYYIRSFGGDRKGVGKASPQYQKDSMSF